MTASNDSSFSLYRCLLILVTFGLALPGCGGSSGLPPGETGTVSGMATFNGNPIPAGSTIMMLHKETGHIAMGTVTDGGSFKLMMRGGVKILAGTYDVGVTPPGGDESQETTPASTDNPDALKDAYLSAGGDTEEKVIVDAWPEIPKSWRSAESSGKTFDVKPGENEWKLELK